MSNVQFEENDAGFQSRKIFGEPVTPKTVLFLMHFFHIKRRKTAGVILLGISLLSFLSSIIILFFYFNPHSTKTILVNQNLPAKIKSALPRTK